MTIDSTSDPTPGDVRFAVNTTYEPYSHDPDYIAGNREYVGMLDFANVGRMLDLACGIGTLTDLVWEAKPSVDIVGVDISEAGIAVAKKKFADRGRLRESGEEAPARDGKGRIEFRVGSADETGLPDASFDAVLMGHSIHLLPDHDKLLREIHRVLKPGGWFSFASSFYAGTFPEGTEQIYHDWVKNSLAYVMSKDRELRAAGHPGIPRKRTRGGGAFANVWPSLEEWRDCLTRNGFSLERENVRVVPLTQYSFEAIGAFAGFATVILSGYPAEIGSEALQATAGPTLEAAGVTEVPRNWLEIVARREG